MNPFNLHHSSAHSKSKDCVNYEHCSMPGMLTNLGSGAVVATLNFRVKDPSQDFGQLQKYHHPSRKNISSLFKQI